ANNRETVQINGDVVDLRSDVDGIVVVRPTEQVGREIIRPGQSQIGLIIRDRVARLDLRKRLKRGGGGARRRETALSEGRGVALGCQRYAQQATLGYEFHRDKTTEWRFFARLCSRSRSYRFVPGSTYGNSLENRGIAVTLAKPAWNVNRIAGRIRPLLSA